MHEKSRRCHEAAFTVPQLREAGSFSVPTLCVCHLPQADASERPEAETLCVVPVSGFLVWGV